ncbi:MAG: hypothetical protein H6825_14095 [Planctomycetes bacterium]|nr:hypothetical protein [Planctomycetota bacterium]
MSLCARVLFRSVVPCAMGLLAVGLRAGDLVPLAGEELATQYIQYEQEWGKVVMDEAATRYAVSWNGPGTGTQEIFVRFFAGDGTPLTDEYQVNANLKSGIQDEAMMAMDEDGYVVVCWSDRHGYDGFNMGCFGRVFDPSGVPLGPEFQINASTAPVSQWEPMPAALPGGGWVIAFNGDDDGNAYIRYFDRDGTPRTGDIEFNSYTNNGQTEAECAVSPLGVVMTVYADFGGNVQAGTGTNLFVRFYDDEGNLLSGLETVANTSTLPFDQLEPRIDADGLDGFVMVWEDAGNDGSGYGIWCRRYGVDGQARGPEFRVNQVTSGNQRLPEVAADHVGNFVVTWEDASSGQTVIKARWYDHDGLPLGDEFPVTSFATGNSYRPSVAVDQAGERVVFAFGGPPVAGSNNTEDVFTRRYAHAALALSGSASIGTSEQLDLELPSGEGLVYAVLASFSSTSGLALPDGRVLPVDYDALMLHSLAFPNTGFPFVGFQGVLGPGATASASIVLPANPTLVGIPLHFACLTLDTAFVGLKYQLRHVTREASFVIE